MRRKRSKKIKRAEKLSLCSFKKIKFKQFVFLLLTILTSVSFVLVPKVLFSHDYLYKQAFEHAVCEKIEDTALHSYKVYATQKRFDNGLEKEIALMKEVFKKENQILAVAIKGESSITFMDDYIFIKSPYVPELNIEFRAVSNLLYSTTSIPIDSFLSFGDSISKIINYIHIPLTFIIHVTLLIYFSKYYADLCFESYKRKKLN